MLVLQVNGIPEEDIESLKQYGNEFIDILIRADLSNIAVVSVFASLLAESLHIESNEAVRDALVELTKRTFWCVQEMRKSDLESN